MKRLDISTRSYPNTFTMVDDEDYDRLNQWKWSPIRKDGKIYVRRAGIKLHRFLMPMAEDMEVDHIDGDPFNNTKANLRTATRSQNGINVAKTGRPTSSRYKGVSWSTHFRKWRAQIKCERKCFNLGWFKDEVEAARKYNTAATHYFGEFARLNIIDAALGTHRGEG